MGKYAFIRETVAPAVICEGVFVDTKADSAQADTLAEQQTFGVAYAIMRCDSDSGKKLIKSMVLRTADKQGMC